MMSPIAVEAETQSTMGPKAGKPGKSWPLPLNPNTRLSPESIVISLLSGDPSKLAVDAVARVSMASIWGSRQQFDHRDARRKVFYHHKRLRLPKCHHRQCQPKWARNKSALGCVMAESVTLEKPANGIARFNYDRFVHRKYVKYHKHTQSANLNPQTEPWVNE